MAEFLHVQGLGFYPQCRTKYRERGTGLRNVGAQHSVSTLGIWGRLSPISTGSFGELTALSLSAVCYILAGFLKILRIHDRFLSFQEEALLLMY